MKAISVRQPWAELIIQGRKTIDLRTKKVRYRGPLAIHASQVIEKEACGRFEIDPNNLTVGAVIGVVELADILEVNEDDYNGRVVEHLNHRRYKEGLFGWQFESPKELAEPQMFKGRQGVFDIPDDLLKGHNKTERKKPSLYNIDGLWNPEKPFLLSVITEKREKNTKIPYRLALYQPVVKFQTKQKKHYSNKPPKMVKVVELGNQTLQAVADHVLDALRENDYKPTHLSPNRREPFALSEDSGVRLGLLFLTIKPISKMDRIEAISHGLRAMTSEELYYWYSKCTTRPAAERAQKALRVLLAAE